MTFLEAILLGLLQGLTEFLPVSSSGHLALAEHWLGFHEPMLLFNVLLHGGTLLAVILYFARDIVRILGELPALILALVRRQSLAQARIDHPHGWMGLMVALATLPTGVMAIIAKDFIESLFTSTLAVGFALLITAGLLMLTRLKKPLPARAADGPAPANSPGLGQSLIVGVMQGLAMVPGISRSGSTISSGILLGMSPEEATRFSFLLALPAILGAVVLEGRHLGDVPSATLLPYLAGTAAALLAGLASLRLLTYLAKRARLHLFAYYCLALGALAIGLSLI